MFFDFFLYTTEAPVGAPCCVFYGLELRQLAGAWLSVCGLYSVGCCELVPSYGSITPGSVSFPIECFQFLNLFAHPDFVVEPLLSPRLRAFLP